MWLSKKSETKETLRTAFLILESTSYVPIVFCIRFGYGFSYFEKEKWYLLQASESFIKIEVSCR